MRLGGSGTIDVVGGVVGDGRAISFVRNMSPGGNLFYTKANQSSPQYHGVHYLPLVGTNHSTTTTGASATTTLAVATTANVTAGMLATGTGIPGDRDGVERVQQQRHGHPRRPLGRDGERGVRRHGDLFPGPDGGRHDLHRRAERQLRLQSRRLRQLLLRSVRRRVLQPVATCRSCTTTTPTTSSSPIPSSTMSILGDSGTFFVLIGRHRQLQGAAIHLGERRQHTRRT